MFKNQLCRVQYYFHDFTTGTNKVLPNYFCIESVAYLGISPECRECRQFVFKNPLDWNSVLLDN